MKTGITGGIGAGKSYVRGLLKARGIEVYDCDQAAKRLMRNSADIRQQLTTIIGADAYIDGVPNKAAIARFLLQSDVNAHAIDAIVHPAVFRDFEQSGMLWMESARLYESGIDRLVDRVIVVTAPLDVRIWRITQRDGITADKALEWIHRQWPQDELLRRADYEIINDGEADLEAQLEQLLK